MRIDPGNYLLQVAPNGRHAVRRLPDQYPFELPPQQATGPTRGQNIIAGAKAGVKVGLLGGLARLVVAGIKLGPKAILNPLVLAGTFAVSALSGAITGGSVGFFLKRGQQ